MIRAGYSYDPTGFNKESMGSLTDLNRAFSGYTSPLKDQLDELVRQKKEQSAEMKRKQKGASGSVKSWSIKNAVLINKIPQM